MIIYPAIDLLEGECVRLMKGDFTQKTVYAKDAIALSQSFAQAGATHLHLVDLSGAKDPSRRQAKVIGKLIAQTRLKVQTGGGLRTRDEVKSLFDLGVDRVVVGSLAVSDPELLYGMYGEFGSDRLTLALDVVFHASDYRVAVDGWKTISEMRLSDMIAQYQTELGKRGEKVTRIICTDISRDGMMSGPNLKLYQILLERFPEIDFQASGGIRSYRDLEILEQARVKSAVVGRAIYEGAISVSDLFKSRGSNAH